MRIICWNIRGTGIRDLDLPDRLDSWGADVAIFLEPSSWMRQKGSGESILLRRPGPRQTPENSHWRIKGYLEGHSQGHVAVSYQESSKVAFQGVQVHGTAQDNHLVLITATVGTEIRRIATCHAPFAANSGEAQQYITNVGKLLKDRAAQGVGAIDVWMGDFNTYGNTTPQGCSPEYVISLAKPSSGFGTNAGSHYPLDKVVVHANLNAQKRGRIIPKSVAQTKQGNEEDIVENDWTTDQKVPSDHLPIYIDTSAVVVPAPVSAPDSDGGSKRFLFADPPRIVKRPKVGDA